MALLHPQRNIREKANKQPNGSGMDLVMHDADVELESNSYEVMDEKATDLRGESNNNVLVRLDTFSSLVE